MISLRQWLRDARFEPKPWLVLGKGPTFAGLTPELAAAHNLFGLNHVVREVPLTIAHAIDVDVIADCAAELRESCRWLLMPRRPHQGAAPGERLLEGWFADLPVLRELDAAGQLVCYDCSTSPRVGDGPVIEVEHFSSEAAFEILGRMGVRRVASLGIDGGTRYSSAFADLSERTRLENGQALFDRQFERIDAIVRRYGIEHEPLVRPVRVLIGCDESTRVAAKVLEFSLRKHASLPLDVKRIDAVRQAERVAIGPLLAAEAVGRSGKAVYLDAAALAVADVADLWWLPLGDAGALHVAGAAGTALSRVLVLDCARLPHSAEVAGRLRGGVPPEVLVGEWLQQVGACGTIPPRWAVPAGAGTTAGSGSGTGAGAGATGADQVDERGACGPALVQFEAPDLPWREGHFRGREQWLDAFAEAVAAMVVDVGEVRGAVRRGLLAADLAGSLPPPMDGGTASPPARGPAGISLPSLPLPGPGPASFECARRGSAQSPQPPPHPSLEGAPAPALPAGVDAAANTAAPGGSEELERLRRQVRCLHREIANLRLSATFRTGRLVLAPLRAALRLLGRCGVRLPVGAGMPRPLRAGAAAERAAGQ